MELGIKLDIPIGKRIIRVQQQSMTLEPVSLVVVKQRNS
jgi:hypothetical protein